MRSGLPRGASGSQIGLRAEAPGREGSKAKAAVTTVRWVPTWAWPVLYPGSPVENRRPLAATRIQRKYISYSPKVQPFLPPSLSLGLRRTVREGKRGP